MTTNVTLPYEISIFNNYQESQQLNNDYCILFVFSGSVEIQLNNQVHSLESQQLLAIHPQDDYSLTTSAYTTAAWIRFRYNYFTKTFNKKNPKLNLSSSAYPSGKYRILIQKTKDLIDKYFQEDKQNRNDVFVLEYILFLREHAINENMDTLPLSKKEERILLIQDYIETNYMNSITLNELADALHLTPQYLATFIKNNLNTTFNNYLYKIRLSHAVRDMVATKDSLTHIAFNHGFPNISTFNRIFKEFYQKTPQNYRNQYKKNIDFLNIKETPFPLFKESQIIYKNFLKTELEKGRKSEKTTHVQIDKQYSKKMEHVWSQVLNLGHAKDLNDFALNDQIRLIISDIPFLYGRITGLFHPDMMPYIASTKRYDFHNVDSILDIVYNLHLKPFIVLGKPEPVFNNNHQAHYVYSNNEFADFSKTFTAFIRHCIMRYGADEFEQWIFEFSYSPVEAGYFSKNQFFYKYIKNSCDAYRILKQTSPNTLFGGPGHRLAQSDHSVMQILEMWKDNQVVPDFFTVFAYPIERSNAESPTPLKPISVNPHIHRVRMLELQQHLKDFYGCMVPVYITELGFHFCNKKYLSDSRFLAAYLVQSIADLWDLCPVISLPAASDLHYRPLTSTQLLSGSNGIISIDGIKKPAFFTLMLLKNLGTQIVYKTQGALATRHRDLSHRILLYNYKHPNNYYCAHPEYEITPENFDDIFTDNLPAQFTIPLNFLPEGNYFIIEYTLDKENGSILDKWIECGKGEKLLHHILLHLRHHMDIGFVYQPLKVNSDTILNYSINPHDLKLVTIYPVDAE